MSTDENVTRVRYKAFISYSHRDSAVARWLHRALETYRVPQHLIGRETTAGKVEKRLGALFRDRDELPVAADLTGQINDALKATQFLIVLCSTASAQSKWVNQEVVNFKRLKGAGSIIAVIVDGEPYASTMPGRAAEECFVPGLRFQVAADGSLTDTPAEPIAADLRPGKDGKRLVKLKVLAGLLGVGLDELVQRENQRRQRFMAGAMAASLALVGVMGVLTWQALNARNYAEAQRGQAEELIEFMLSDLQVPLREIGRLTEFNKVSERAIAYYQSESLAGLPDDSLGRRARAFHLLGETRLQEKDYETAQNVLNSAATATAELLDRDPNNVQRLTDHGQSKFWLGRTYLEQGNVSAAISAMNHYVALASLAANREPNNMPLQANAARSRVSLVAGLIQMGECKAALEELDIVNDKWREIERERPNDNQVLQEIANSLGFAADCLLELGNLPESLAKTKTALLLHQQVLGDKPSDKNAEFRLIRAQRRYARLLFENSQAQEAESVLYAAADRLQTLIAYDSKNARWKEENAGSLVDMAAISLELGKTSIAEQILHNEEVKAFIESRPDPKSSSWYLWANAQLIGARIALSKNVPEEAMATISILLDTNSGADPRRANLHALRLLEAQVYLILGDIIATSQLDVAHTCWKAAINTLSSPALRSVPRASQIAEAAHNKIETRKKIESQATDQAKQVIEISVRNWQNKTNSMCTETLRAHQPNSPP